MMKKNKLYTMRKGMPAMFVDKQSNIFWPGGGLESLSATNPADFFGINSPTYTPTQNSSGKAAFNPFSFKDAFSKQGMNKALNAGAGAAIGIGANFVGGLAGNAISGGLESGAGSAISNIGGQLGSAVGAVNPIAGAVVGAGSQILGGLTNRMFGSKLNEENINTVNNNINNLTNQANAIGAAQTSEDLLNNWNNTNMGFDFSNSYIGTDGWFSSKAKRKAEELRRKQEQARALAKHSLTTGAQNVDTNMDNDIFANFSAFGGPLFALGGDVQMHGADFSTELSHINAGGSHEENPNDGVQMGVDNEGIPNLVEEGETVWNDYVFSNRILADDATKQMFKLPKKKDVTFADISKKLEKEIAERPNDPISKAGFEAQMQTLEEQQERQKSEMEAERAKAAFEALSPEEQTAVMQNAAEQEAMAQQAAQEQAIAEQQAMQQPSPEEVAIMQQQADGTEAALGQPAPEMAEGGKLFKKGGYKWDSFWSPVNEYSKQKGNAKNKYKIDKTYKGDIKELENSDAYKAFTDYILNNATDEERLNYFKWIDANTGKENKYLDKDGKLLEGWQEAYRNARNDGLYGIQHYTPEFDPELMVATTSNQPAVSTINPEARIHHAMDGDDYDGYIEGELDPNVVGAETRREVLPNGDTVIYHGRAKTPAATPIVASEATKTSPRHRAEWLRYAGLFGPAVGLGMQLAGVGKPDYSRLDAAVESVGNAHLADYKPLGNYLTYRPMDIWFEQNRMNANARATDRAIMNSTSPSRMAGLLANSYNSQLASGDLYRKALEYNDAKRERVASFNRGTDQFNAEAYNRNSQFNADALNRNRQYRAGLAMQAARDRMAGDASWYNGIYGNVAGLFRGLADLGRENYQHNQMVDLLGSGALPGITEEKLVKSGLYRYAKEGGKIKRKKNKRGLTF